MNAQHLLPGFTVDVSAAMGQEVFQSKCAELEAVKHIRLETFPSAHGTHRVHLGMTENITNLLDEDDCTKLYMSLCDMFTFVDGMCIWGGADVRNFASEGTVLENIGWEFPSQEVAYSVVKGIQRQLVRQQISHYTRTM